MIEGKTPSGISFEIDEAKMDDMRVIDALSDLQGGDVLAVVPLTRLFLGKDLRDRIYDAVRTPDGRIPVEAFTKELTAIFEAAGQKKS